MTRETNRDRILRFLRENVERFCDDCLSDLATIRPRQTVRQICTVLATEGVIARTKDLCGGPQGEKSKWVNQIDHTGHRVSTTTNQAPERARQIVALVEAHTTMNKALDRLDHSPSTKEFFAQKLARLKGQGIVDPQVAEMMFMINKFRNLVVKEGKSLDPEEWGVFQSGIALVAKRLDFSTDKIWMMRPGDRQ